MIEALIISRDAELRERLKAARVEWVDSPEGFESALSKGLAVAFVDVCVDCGSQRDIADIVRDCRQRGGARRVVAFLSACGGDAAIRAHLAGADRVIPVDQLEGELAELLDS